MGSPEFPLCSLARAVLPTRCERGFAKSRFKCKQPVSCVKHCKHTVAFFRCSEQTIISQPPLIPSTNPFALRGRHHLVNEQQSNMVLVLLKNSEESQHIKVIYCLWHPCSFVRVPLSHCELPQSEPVEIHLTLACILSCNCSSSQHSHHAMRPGS